MLRPTIAVVSLLQARNPRCLTAVSVRTIAGTSNQRNMMNACGVNQSIVERHMFLPLETGDQVVADATITFLLILKLPFCYEIVSGDIVTECLQTFAASFLPV